jgi:hypothetical protein
MSMLRPMRDELFKYRKRKRRSIDGSVPGAPYVGYSRSRRPVSGVPYQSRGPGYHHDLYMWGSPGEYRPSLNAPAVQETEYDPYEPVNLHHIPRHNNPKLPHDDIDQGIPIPSSIPEDDLTLTEPFLTAMGAKDEIEWAVLEGPRFNINEKDLVESAPTDSQLPVELRSVDEVPSLEDLKDAFVTLVDVLPEDHPDLVNVRTAMRKVRDHHITLSDIEDLEKSSDPLRCDPIQEAEQFFEQQMALLEKTFDEPAVQSLEDVLEAQATEPGMILDELGANALFEQGLEEIVEQDDPFETPLPEFMGQDVLPAGMDVDEISHAIDQVSGQPAEMEPDPFAPQYDPYIAAQMFDEQIQYMADPFMMPGPVGPMPMPGP